MFSRFPHSKTKALAFVASGKGNDSNWLGTTRSLGEKGVHIIRISPKSWYSSKYCSTILFPRMQENPQIYMKKLLNLGRKFSQIFGYKPLLFPSSDNLLIPFSQNKDLLEEYFIPIVADWDCTKKIVDKALIYDAAKKIGIQVPETYVLENFEELNKLSKNVKYPCLVKPSHSHIFSGLFNIKLFEVNSEKMLIKICKRLLAQQLKLLIQEKIVGGDDQLFSFGTCFNSKSEPLTIFTQRKIRQYPPNFGIGSFKESVWEPKIIELGMRLLKEIGFFGIGSVEFKRDQRTGKFVLMEINGRSNTSMYLATKCGLNIPYILYSDIVCQKIEPIIDYSCQYELGVKWFHLKLDFITMLLKRKNREIEINNWLRNLFGGKKTYAFFSITDPNPFFSEIRSSLNEIRKLRSRFLNQRN